MRNSALEFEHFEGGHYVLKYAEAMLASSGAVVHKNITFGNTTDTPIYYSNGFISKRNDAVFVCLFDMTTGAIYTNAKNGAQSWIGWKKIG